MFAVSSRSSSRRTAVLGSLTLQASVAPRPLYRTVAVAARRGLRLCSRESLAAPGRHQISEVRLRQFLEAEVSFFAEQQSNSITLREVLDATTPERAARLSHAELPTRFAHRIRQIEALPGWDTSQDLREVHDYYYQSFRELRLIELDGGNYDSFTAVVNALKGRMKGVVPRLARGMRDLQQRRGFSETTINEWLDMFLLSRIGTEMLTSQYMAVVDSERSPRRRRKGIVDDACDPARICEQAASHARKLCRQHFRSSHDVRIFIEKPNNREPSDAWADAEADQSRIQFPYVPQYLYYIMLELLKNSARATVENCSDKRQLRERPIVITVVADESQVVIRVDDLAGGIPFSVADRVWSYMYTTVGSGSESAAFSQEGTPLAGYGVGLPLSRLYARYLGGSLQLMSLPGIGTSAYLYLKRLENEAREELPGSSTDAI